MVYGKAVSWVSFFNWEPCLLHGFSFTFRSWARLGVLVGVLARAVYPLLVLLKQWNKMSQTKKKKIPAIRHHKVTEKRSYQYNKLYSTIDLHYAVTLHFESLRVFLDIPPLSIVGPSGTQSTSSSLPPNSIVRCESNVCVYTYGRNVGPRMLDTY